MTPEAQRIAIAEASGWTRVWDSAFRQWIQRSPDKSLATCDPDPNANWELHRLPDYLNDLNAMHEADEILTDQQHNRFRKHLAHVVGERESPSYSTPGWRRRYVSATARQRAEAFLRTIGKWEESE